MSDLGGKRDSPVRDQRAWLSVYRGAYCGKEAVSVLYDPVCRDDTDDQYIRLAELWGAKASVKVGILGVTEQLKSQNQFLWIQKMSNILACVREVVENEIIYS